jgi:hypothetical protein
MEKTTVSTRRVRSDGLRRQDAARVVASCALPAMRCRLAGGGEEGKCAASLEGVRQSARQVCCAARERRSVERPTPPVAPRKRIVWRWAVGWGVVLVVGGFEWFGCRGGVLGRDYLETTQTNARSAARLLLMAVRTQKTPLRVLLC